MEKRIIGLKELRNNTEKYISKVKAGETFVIMRRSEIIFKIVPVVLTLPGIAGFILSIGMATDANILIFERIKEEILWGKPKNLAISLGFDRAWSSIKDSNISSLLTAGVLFYFGSGPVRGFALTLAIGVIVSMFTAIFVSRTFIEVFKFGYDTKTIPVRTFPGLFRRKERLEDNENN